MDADLRVIVTQYESGLIEGQLLEFDIVVAAHSVDGLLEELAHQIKAEYYIAKNFGKIPFASLGRADDEFYRIWDMNSASATDMGTIDLPDEVEVALATALRAQQPVFHLKRVYKAAA